MTPAEQAWQDYNSKLSVPWLSDGDAHRLWLDGRAAGLREALECEPTEDEALAYQAALNMWRERIAAKLEER